MFNSIMGAQLAYRKKPMLDFETERGSKSFYKFGASRITGWRKSQEDRLICIPEFHEDFSLFAVYDGHGGSEVSEYLFRNFSKHLISFLDENEVESALQLSFLSFDSSIRDITEEEKAELLQSENEEDSEDELPTRKDVITALKSYSSNIAGSSKEGTSDNSEDSRKQRVESETLKFLTQAELEPDDDDDDESYDEEDTHDEEMDSSDVADSDSNSSFEDESASNEEPEDESGLPKPKVGYCCGSTAVVVLLNSRKVYVANVGDSRCVAAVNGRAIDLSVDHKPSGIEELIRIKEAGSRVTSDDRIDGGLNMSRAFGDFAQKKNDDISEPIICDPHITSANVNEDLDFIVIASDGIWNSMSSQEVVDYIHLRIKDAQLQDICEELFKFILAPDASGDGTGCDNMSIIIIEFNKKSQPFLNSHVVYDNMELDSEQSRDSFSNIPEKSTEKKNLGTTENKNLFQDDADNNKDLNQTSSNDANHDCRSDEQSEDDDVIFEEEIIKFPQPKCTAERCACKSDLPSSSLTSHEGQAHETVNMINTTLAIVQNFLHNIYINVNNKQALLLNSPNPGICCSHPCKNEMISYLLKRCSQSSTSNPATVPLSMPVDHTVSQSSPNSASSQAEVICIDVCESSSNEKTNVHKCNIKVDHKIPTILNIQSHGNVEAFSPIEECEMENSGEIPEKETRNLKAFSPIEECGMENSGKISEKETRNLKAFSPIEECGMENSDEISGKEIETKNWALSDRNMSRNNDFTLRKLVKSINKNSDKLAKLQKEISMLEKNTTNKNEPLEPAFFPVEVDCIDLCKSKCINIIKQYDVKDITVACEIPTIENMEECLIKKSVDISGKEITDLDISKNDMTELVKRVNENSHKIDLLLQELSMFQENWTQDDQLHLKENQNLDTKSINTTEGCSANNPAEHQVEYLSEELNVGSFPKDKKSLSNDKKRNLEEQSEENKCKKLKQQETEKIPENPPFQETSETEDDKIIVDKCSYHENNHQMPIQEREVFFFRCHS